VQESLTHCIASPGVASSSSGGTLWTGDLGTALYLADCVDGGGALPIP
jgi:hypothetical protein